MNLSQGVALITGGTQGIGFYTARNLLKRGVKGVTITGRNAKVGKYAEYLLCKEFGAKRVLYVQADVESEEQSRRAFEQTINKFENVDILCNNAGIRDEPLWSNSVATNFKGTVLNTRLAMTEYLEKYKCMDYGIILNIGSISSIDVLHFAPIYTGTKQGVLSFTRALFSEQIREAKKINTMILLPGVTMTKLFEAGGEELAKLVANLPKQTAKECGSAAGKIIELNEHGKIWVCEGNKLFKIEMPKKEVYRTPIPAPAPKAPECSKSYLLS